MKDKFLAEELDIDPYGDFAPDENQLTEKDVILEYLGEISDTLENLVAATIIPMPSDFHLEQVKENLNILIKDIREKFVIHSSCNPWGEDEKTSKH